MSRRIYLATLAGAVLALSSTAFAQQQASAGTTPGQGTKPTQVVPVQGQNAPTSQRAAQGHSMGQAQGRHAGAAASADYMAAMNKMSRDMQMPMTGDADHDFAMMMIPHHQGAIDMARVQLQHGKDPKMRKTAQKVIKDQEKEIADLQKWLKQQKR